MKTLYLLRHAKSDWANEGLEDIDRPLNARGYRDAHEMSLRLKERKEIPDLIVSSHATRTTSTGIIFLRELEMYETRFVLRKALYAASADEIIKVIREFPDEYDKIMLVTHNPGITNVINRVCNASIDNVPTCGLACVDLEMPSWKTTGEIDGELRYFDFPKKQK